MPKFGEFDFDEGVLAEEQTFLSNVLFGSRAAEKVEGTFHRS